MKDKLDLLPEYPKVSEENSGEWLRQKGLHRQHINLFRQELISLMANKTDEKIKEFRN